MHYRSQHTGRRLTWQLGLGNADVRATFKNRKHDLNVSTLGLVVLLLFEEVADGEFLTYEVRTGGVEVNVYPPIITPISCQRGIY